MSFYVVEVDNDGFKVYDSGGTLIDPAKDATVAGVTTVLSSIKDTDGIKKITDPLPAGTNKIGEFDLASAIPAGSNIIGTLKLVDAAGINLLLVDGSGRAAIQNQPNMDVALSTRATEATLQAVEGLLTTIDADTGNLDVALSTRATEATLQGVNTRIGEVSASPTANTVLDRLKVIKDFLDAEDFASQTTLASLLSAFNAEDFATQTTLAIVDGRLTTIDAVLDSIKDTDGIKKITDQLPAGTNEIGKVAQGTKAALADAWPTVVTDAAGNAISSQDDAGTRRLEISGKVSVTGASPPPATNAAVIVADNPLSVGSHDTTFVIPNGQTYYLQEVIAGNEDPTKGAVIEVIYFDGTEHPVGRTYIAGFTITEGFPNRGTARDGTPMIGNVGGTNTILVRRTKYAGSNIAIDAIVRGYTL